MAELRVFTIAVEKQGVWLPRFRASERLVSWGDRLYDVFASVITALFKLA